MDSLRYWVQDMHVDGFRFDLAPVLVARQQRFRRVGPFFKAAVQDPVLSQGVKLIAEPWDVGPGGYHAGAVSPPAGANGTTVPRHDARLLALRRPHPPELALVWRVDGLCCQWPATHPWIGQYVVTVARWLHARRPGQLRHAHNLANRENNRDGTATTAAGTAVARAPR